MFTQTAEYALRAIAHLAQNGDVPQTSQQISEATKVPTPYLSKVLQSLVKGGLVTGQRGLHGGFTMVKPPSEVSIYEVLSIVDPIKRIKRCPLGLESHGTHLCPLHRRMDEAIASVERNFKDTTLAEILDEPTTSVPLCPFPSGIKPQDE